ncbi:hypothetical protein JTE90_014428 [Oedothorax gibbosus]|uniref:BHLH domain-containing protein n=1 Tax=Oedothorax gibbosus TaxID=931172 RepID=A0AAV6V2N6_9ARAC|nr:hypothetical protein JTE90_014428 [Oedothorax gibbosus]
MASMTLLSDNLMGNPSYYLTTTTSLNTSHTYSSSSSSTSSIHSPPPPTLILPQQRIAPKLPHQKYTHQHLQQQQDCEDLMRCKRRIQLGHLPSSGKTMTPQPAAVARRNERERNRVRLVNHGFATLRQHVPSTTKNKKMSKVDTLKSAVEYIKRLQELLGELPPTTSSQHSADENSYPVGGQSSTGSPTPSLCSEASSPYDAMHEQQEEDLMDFAAWF